MRRVHIGLPAGLSVPCGRIGALAMTAGVLLSAGARAQAAPGETVAIVDVGLALLHDERVIEHQTLVARDGRIVAVGPTADVQIPKDAARVDGRGRFVMPGLADMHVHLFNARDLVLYVANGITTIRNLGGYQAADSILRIRQEVRDGRRLGPTIYTSGNWLDGDTPFRPENTIVRTPEDAERVVAQQVDAGYEFIKVYVPSMYGPSADGSWT